jgi:hypothetical protein
MSIFDTASYQIAKERLKGNDVLLQRTEVVVTNLLIKEKDKPFSRIIVVITSGVTELSVGQIITFGSVKGLVEFFDKASKTASVKVWGEDHGIELNQKGEVLLIGKKAKEKLRVREGFQQGGKLFIKCKLPTPCKEGFLGWSLYFNNDLIVIGNDLQSKSEVLFDGGSSWGAGSYSIFISQFDERTKEIVSFGTKSWEVEEERVYIGGRELEELTLLR